MTFVVFQIRCASPSFVDLINKEVKSFVDKLREDRSNQRGQVTLEFYSKKKRGWSFVEDSFRWEFWTVRIDTHNHQSHRLVHLEEVLLEKVISIVQIVNSSRIYLPPMPTQQLLTTVFDTNFPDVQPYLFKVSFSRTLSPLLSKNFQILIEKYSNSYRKMFTFLSNNFQIRFELENKNDPRLGSGKPWKQIVNLL